MTVNDPSPGDDAVIHWNAVLRGALAGLFFLVLASVAEAILDRNIDTFRDSGWIYPLFVVILFGYMLGGFGAGRLVPQAALSNGKDTLNFAITEGTPATFRYRVLLIDGNPTEADMQRYAQQWAATNTGS